MNRVYISAADLAARWHVSKGHLANLRARGQGIGYRKIGTRVVYDLAEVIAFEDAAYVPGAA